MIANKQKKIITLALLILLPIAVYTIIISENGVDNFLHTIKTISMAWIICAIVCMLIYWTIDALILYITCLFVKTPLPYKSALANTFVGQFVNSVTPFATGGQPMQIYHLTSTRKMSAGIAGTVTLLKFVIYQSTLTLYSLAVIIFKWNTFSVQLSNMLMLSIAGFLLNSAIIVFCNIFAHNKAMANKIILSLLKILKFLRLVKDIDSKYNKIEMEIVHFYNGYKMLKSNMKMWVVCVILTALQLTSIYAVPYFINRSFGYNGYIVDMVSAMAFLQMLISFVPLPGASGAAEGSFYIFFRLFFEKEALAAAILIWRIITYYSCILAGAIYFTVPLIKSGLSIIYKKEG